ncbi:CpsD/CapB family tyrosine-protein kinase [Tabrizicola sp.]|uniref:CpsD/CapB family tyrosine-protein kinase n=1 Tax=Tabrizicola sp. TaxID=2005166 RepID=UPI002FDC8DE7
MERIQSALAKARSARDRKLQPNSGKAGADPWQELAEVMPDQKVLARNLIVAQHPGQAASSFDVMRTNLLRALRANGWTRVAITSPSPGCGKSTVALNLAFSLARMADKRVLLIELDLRHPSLIEKLGLPPNQNFIQSIGTGTLDFAQIRRVGTNLALALNSTPLDSPAELLSAPRTADLIDEVEARLRPDIILFDMSPLLVSDDALAYLDQVDCALMVAAAEESTLTEIEKCGADLGKRTQVLGVVLNKCRYMEEDETRAYPE